MWVINKVHKFESGWEAWEELTLVEEGLKQCKYNIHV